MNLSYNCGKSGVAINTGMYGKHPAHYLPSQSNTHINCFSVITLRCLMNSVRTNICVCQRGNSKQGNNKYGLKCHLRHYFELFMFSL